MAIDDFGLFLSLHHNEVELQNRELFLDRERGPEPTMIGNPLLLGLAFQREARLTLSPSTE